MKQHRRPMIKPHPECLELLFQNREHTFRTFNDVLGLHGIDHMAITEITEQGEIIVYSSTPSLEFNLLKGNLWCFDETYAPAWFLAHKHSAWDGLYSRERYDELYYIKQAKYDYLHAYSLGITLRNKNFIYSLASKQSTSDFDDLFIDQLDVVHRIGEYCINRLELA